MSKKGLFIDMMTGVQSMILLVVIMVLFGIAFIFLSSDSTLHENKYFPQEDLKLIDYLKTPIIIDNQETTLGDFIISANSDLEKRRVLRSEIRKVISPYPKTGIENRIKIIFPDNDYWKIGELDSDREIVSGAYITNREITEDEVLQISAISLPAQDSKKGINITLFEDPNKITRVSGIPKSNAVYYYIKSGGAPLKELVETAPKGEIIEDYTGDKWVKLGIIPSSAFGDDNIWMSEGFFCNTKIINGNVANQQGEVVCDSYPNFPLEFDFNSHPLQIPTLTRDGICGVFGNTLLERMQYGRFFGRIITSSCCERSNWHDDDTQPSGTANTITVVNSPFNIDPEYTDISKGEIKIKTPSVYGCAASEVYPRILKYIKQFGDEFKLKSPKKYSQKEIDDFIDTYSDMNEQIRSVILWGGTQIITPDDKWWMYVGAGNWIEISPNHCNKFIWKKDNQGYLSNGYCDANQYFVNDKFTNPDQKEILTFEQFKELYYHE